MSSGVKDILKDNQKILFLSGGLLLAVILGLYLTKDGGLLSMDSNLSDLTPNKTFSAPTQVMENNIDYKAILKT